MKYIDVLIPLAIGLLFIFQAEAIVREVPDRQKKIRLIKTCGYLLLVVACIYLIAKLLS